MGILGKAEEERERKRREAVISLEFTTEGRTRKRTRRKRVEEGDRDEGREGKTTHEKDNSDYTVVGEAERRDG